MRLYDEGLGYRRIYAGSIAKPYQCDYASSFYSPYFNGINPYTLGYHMMQDIKRICENPTEEDKKWFPYLANTDWLTA